MVAINSEEKLLNTGCDISQIDITIKAIITCEELFKRWPGVSAQKFAQMVNAGRPMPYVCVREVHENNNHHSFICRIATSDTKRPPYHNGFDNFSLYTGLVFSIEEVQQIENIMPNLLSNLNVPRNEYILAKNKANIDNHFIDCAELAYRWHCEKELVSLIIALQGNEFPVSMFDELSYDMPIDNYYMSYYDLLDWESTHNDALNIIKSLVQTMAMRNTNKHHPHERSKQNDAAQCLTNSEELVGTKQYSSADHDRRKRTENASKAIEEKTSKSWENDLCIAVSLACTLAKDRIPHSTKEHSKMWAEHHNAPSDSECRRDAFRAFRRGLPDYLKKEDKAKI